LKRTSVQTDEASIQYGGGEPSSMHNINRHPLCDNRNGKHPSVFAFKLLLSCNWCEISAPHTHMMMQYIFLSSASYFIRSLSLFIRDKCMLADKFDDLLYFHMILTVQQNCTICSVGLHNMRHSNQTNLSI